MNDPNNALLMMLAMAQQQQQQQQQPQQRQQQPQQQQQRKSTGKTAGTSGTNSSSSNSNNQISQQQQQQMVAALAQLSAMAQVQKQAGNNGMTPEMMAAWQTMMQAQMVQQLTAAAVKQQHQAAAELKLKQQQEAKLKKEKEQAEKMKQQQAMQEMLKKMMNGCVKNASSSKEPTTSSSSQVGMQNVMDAAMWQFVAAQMMQQNQQKSKNEAEKKQKEQEKARIQQEQIVKALMAQQQMLKMKNAEQGSSTDSLENNNDKKKVANGVISEMAARLPLQLGWKRQTCVRAITTSGVRGDVSYYGPCGKKVSTYAELQRYLTKTGISYINRDHFSFSTKLIVGEFIVPKPRKEDEEHVQEREFTVLTEEDVNTELAKLMAAKVPQKVEKVEVKKVVEVEEIVEILDDLNDEFTEDPALNGAIHEEHRSREPSDDLLIPEIRHLPDFPRVANQCLNAAGFGDALMIHEFVQNFAHVLGIDLEKAPKLEELCAGLAGDLRFVDQVLQLCQSLLRLVMEFPGMKNEPKFGKGPGEFGLDRENYSEMMRMFLEGRDQKGKKLAKSLQERKFEQLAGDEKAAILAYLCDELVCSPNVISEIDRNLDEISRLKGEKWMREGKARTLKAIQSKKQNGVEEEKDGSESEASRPTTPKKEQPTAVVVTSAATSAAVRKFTPGLGQCEVLTAEEEAMTVKQMENCINELQLESQLINRKIHETNLRIRTFPFGYDRYHRQFWLLAHTPAIMIESVESASRNNPGCNVHEIAAKDPAAIAVEGYLDEDVIGCVEDLVDEVILTRAKADKKTRRRYRRMDNSTKRGWWTLDSKESVDALRAALHGRGIRERCLHRLLTKPWFLNELKLGRIVLEQVGETVDGEVVERQSWKHLGKSVEQLRQRMRMSDVVKESEARKGEEKPLVTPVGMALAQIVRDDVVWKTLDDDSSDSILQPSELRKMIIETAELVDERFWRPSFIDRTAENSLYTRWSTFVNEEAATTSQLMIGLQILESVVAWERSPREALCQICKSMDGDEMLVCDGCETGCHMECFRPAMTTVPSGDWFCPKCRETKSGKKLCMFCLKESGNLVTCTRCAFHCHTECANEGVEKSSSKDQQNAAADTFVCPHCDEVKAMRFIKPVILRGESEERDVEEPASAAGNEQEVNAENGNGILRPVNSGANVEQQRKVAQKRKMPDSPGLNLPIEMNQELCRSMLDEIEMQPGAAIFAEPVNLKQVPGYKEIIAKPMDLGTIRQRNEKLLYEAPEDFASDVELIFSNCRTFNVDDSPVGQAGINLNKFFHKRWRQLKYNYSKRMKRLHRGGAH